MDKLMPIVTNDDEGLRPDWSPDQCIYCKARVGERHDFKCVTVERPVVVEITTQLTIMVPISWDKEQIEFHRNEGTWCADNMQHDLKHHIEHQERCLCSVTKYKYIGEQDG